MIGKKIRVKMNHEQADTAYIALEGYPEEVQFGIVAKSLCLDDVVENFKGPRVNLDFNKEGVLIGIEIVA